MEYCHNHAVNSIEALSFKILSTETKMDLEVPFCPSLTCSQVYYEILRNLQSNSKNKLNFYPKKADRSKYLRRRGFNSLFINYCQDEFGARSSAAMFDKLEEKINEFMESKERAKISYQLYNKDQNSALILAIVTLLMQREHSKAIETSVFLKKLNEI